MIDLHYWPTPNGKKVTILLEECGLPYRLVPCNIGRGDQFQAAFLKICPNNRMPAMVDHEPRGGGEPISLFESGAIILSDSFHKGKCLARDKPPQRTRGGNCRRGGQLVVLEHGQCTHLPAPGGSRCHVPVHDDGVIVVPIQAACEAACMDAGTHPRKSS